MMARVALRPIESMLPLMISPPLSHRASREHGRAQLDASGKKVEESCCPLLAALLGVRERKVGNPSPGYQTDFTLVVSVCQ